MNDIQELLHTGLTRVGEQVRTVDLHRNILSASRALRRRRIAMRTTAGLVGLALALSTATALWSNVDRDGRTPPVDPAPTPTESTESAPWITRDGLAGLAGFDEWFPSDTATPTVCDMPAGPLPGLGRPVNGAGYVISLGGTDLVITSTIAYAVGRYQTTADALEAYEALGVRMDECGPGGTASSAGFQVVDGWTAAGWQMAAAGLRQREQLVARDCPAPCNSDRYRSTLIMQWDRYVAVASWAVPDAPEIFGADSRRARSLGHALLTGMARDRDTGSVTPPGPGSSGELGPDGYGRVRLGMTLAEALATGELDLDLGSGACASVGFLADPGATAVISERLGVVAIWGGPDVSTPEGLHVHATEAEFKSTYPNFRQDLLARVSAAVPGHPDTRYVADLLWTGPDPVGSGSGGYFQVEQLSLVSSTLGECADTFG